MENEELAALRASMLAAERLPAGVRQRQARFSELVAGGDELVPYVLAKSCSDPRDRLVSDEMWRYRVLERPPVLLPPVPRRIAPSDLPRHEPPPIAPSWLPVILAVLAALWFLLRLAAELSFLRPS